MKSLAFISVFAAFAMCTGVWAIDVEFDKIKPGNAKEITNRLKQESNPSFALLDSLVNSLSRLGYIDASMSITNGKLIVSSGQLYSLTKILFIDNATAEIVVNRPFDSSIVARTIDFHLQTLYDSGYHYASCRTIGLSTLGISVSLSVELNKGPRVKQGDILFAGLSRTDKELIKKYLPESTDSILNTNYLTEAERAASQITFAKFMPPLSIQPQPGYTKSNVVFNFIEKTPLRIDGAAGLAGNNENTATWSLGLSLNNLFGTGKQVNIHSDRIEARRRTLSINYSQPLFIIGLGELALGVNSRDFRDEFYEFSLAASYNTRINQSFSSGLNLHWKSVKPETGNSGYNSYSGRFSINRTNFTDEFNPSRGLSLYWGIEFAIREYTSTNLPDPSASRILHETRTIIHSSLYQPLTGPLLAKFAINYVGLETGENFPPLSELVLIGGPKSLRGYRNEQFAALRSAFGTFEPRFKFSRGFLFAFYDSAYLNNRIPAAGASVINDEQFKWSYGIGFGIGGRARNVALSLGLNPEFGFDEPRLSIELSSDL